MRRSTFLSLFFVSLITISLSAQNDWQQLNSGVTSNLNSAWFLNGNTGFVVGDAGTFLKTTNGGQSWTHSTTSPAANLNAVYFFNLNEGIAVGDAGVILRTTDGGTSWSTVTTDVTDNLMSISFNGTKGIIGGLSQTILKSSNNGASWTTVQTGYMGGGFWGAYMVDGNTGYFAGENSIMESMVGKTTDGGANWEWFPFYLNTNEGRLYDVHFFNASTGVVAGGTWEGYGAVASTSNGGTDWSTTIFGEAFNGMSFFGNTGYVVGYNGGIFKTTDAGSSWTGQSSGTTSMLYDVFIADAYNAYAVGQGGLILKSSSNVPVELTSFTSIVKGSSVTLKWETATETNNYGFEVEKAFSSNGTTQKWEAIGFIKGKGSSTEKQQYTYIDDLSKSSQGKIIYRLKQLDFNGSYSYSNELSIENMPKDFALDQNYPNPFNPNTNIKYSLPQKSNVRLEVYNTLGEKISELVNNIQESGNYDVNWNAVNVPSGIYFYTLQVKNIENQKEFRETKKMILLK